MCSMGNEEHNPRCNNCNISGDRGGSGGGGGGGGGGRLLKKMKHNKVPQRGMGVAQLEKLILEERQLKDAVELTSNGGSIKLRRPEIPLPPPPPPNLRQLISKSDEVNADSLCNNWCRLYNFDGENPNPIQIQNQIENQNRYMIATPANPSIFQQFHTQRSQFQTPCSSSMVNVSLGATSSLSSTTSSVMSVQIEPPSIQSYCANKYSLSFMPDGDKMVGLKRSYPFSVENMPIPSFSCNIPPISRSDESISCSNGGTNGVELNIPFCREKPLSSGSIKEQKIEKFIDENLDLTKDFLTLAPPQSSPSSHSRLKEKFSSCQGQTRDSSETEWSNQQPLHSFFPAAKSNGTSNGEVGEHVDLSLKL